MLEYLEHTDQVIAFFSRGKVRPSIVPLRLCCFISHQGSAHCTLHIAYKLKSIWSKFGSSYFLVHPSNSFKTCLHRSACCLLLTWANIGRSSIKDFISATVLPDYITLASQLLQMNPDNIVTNRTHCQTLTMPGWNTRLMHAPQAANVKSARIGFKNMFDVRKKDDQL